MKPSAVIVGNRIINAQHFDTLLELKSRGLLPPDFLKVVKTIPPKVMDDERWGEWSKLDSERIEEKYRV